MKQVLSVQDLSCLGKCSLTVAMPVLSAMGCVCTPLPTALLSSHTAFPDPHIRPLTEDMEKICQHWQTVGASFDAICIGYLASPEQAAAVEKVLDAFPGTVVLDPVMGDHGKRYRGLTDAHAEAVAKLCRRADLLLPNLTEAAFLCGEQPGEKNCLSLLEKLRSFGTSAVIITGVSLQPGMTGFIGFDKEDLFSYQTLELPKKCHGTGDLFAAVVTGALANGKCVKDAAHLAATFVEKAIAATETQSPLGVNFESALPWLWEQ